MKRIYGENDRQIRNESGCPLCGCENVGGSDNSSGYKIFACRSCGFQWARAGTQKQLKGIYSREYFTLSNAVPGKGYKRGYDEYIKTRETKPHVYVPHYDMFLEKIEGLGKFPPGTLLEIGCAAGFFLKRARERGWDCFGVEISDYVAEYAKEKLGLNVFSGTIEESGLGQDLFDVVLAYQVIEHVPDPLKFLDNIYRLLKKDGVVILGTPDCGSLYFRFLKLFGKEYEMIKPPEHVSYFSRKSLCRALKKTGFEVAKVEKEKLSEDSLDHLYFINPDPGIKSAVKKFVRYLMVYLAFPFRGALRRLYVDDKMLVFAKK